MCVSSACRGQERTFRSPATGVTGIGQPLYGCWEQDPGLLEIQPVLLTTEASLPPLVMAFLIQYHRLYCVDTVTIDITIFSAVIVNSDPRDLEHAANRNRVLGGRGVN